MARSAVMCVLCHMFVTPSIHVQMIQGEVERMNAAAKLQSVTPEQKAQSDRKAWQGWLARYAARLQREAESGADPHKRVQTMNATNPRYC